MRQEIRNFRLTSGFSQNLKEFCGERLISFKNFEFIIGKTRQLAEIWSRNLVFGKEFVDKFSLPDENFKIPGELKKKKWGQSLMEMFQNHEDIFNFATEFIRKLTTKTEFLRYYILERSSALSNSIQFPTEFIIKNLSYYFGICDQKLPPWRNIWSQILGMRQIYHKVPQWGKFWW